MIALRQTSIEPMGEEKEQSKAKVRLMYAYHRGRVEIVGLNRRFAVWGSVV
jgi:hypothetical protein